MIIGVILGIAIIFNWSSIKDYIDAKFSSEVVAVQQQKQKEISSSDSQADGSNNEKTASDNKSEPEKKDDVFKKFK